MKKLAILMPLVLFLAQLEGCALASRRLVAFPVRGQNSQEQARDSAYCEDVATGTKDDPATNALIGGVGGGVLGGAVGGAVGGIFGGSSGAGRNAAAGAIVGAVSGIIGGIAETQRRYYNIYAACMNSRGYSVGG